MTELNKINNSIGQLEGKMDLIIAWQEKQDSRDEKMDERLRKTENRSAVNGLVSGGLVSGLILVIKELLKTSTTGS